jgi:DNA-3-methyladenine glycosylase
LGNDIYLMDDKMKINHEDIGISKRIGVESAGQDGLLPYRFYLRGNKFVSGKNK